MEEADELADRICILTQGQILTIDTPNEINKRYGVGFKIIIEPNMPIEEFQELKSQTIDPNIMLTEEN